MTDLEISFGVLGDPGQQPRSFFYFREPLPYAGMPPELAALYADSHDTDPAAADRATRLAALKQEIETRLPGRVRHYSAGWDNEPASVTGLEAWGRSVIEDVWPDLEAEAGSIGIGEEISWQQAERNALDDYAEDRARDFVGRGTYPVTPSGAGLFSASTRSGLGSVLNGCAGIWQKRHLRRAAPALKQSNVFVLAHAAAASPRAPSVEDMLRRWIEELGGALGVDPGLAENADPETIETTFHSLLGRLAVRRRVVVLVDALDQFEATTQGRFATWLPRLWPANARLHSDRCSGRSFASARRAIRRQNTAIAAARYQRGPADHTGDLRSLSPDLEPEVVNASWQSRARTARLGATRYGLCWQWRN